MTLTSKKLIGNHALASFMSKLRKEMMPSLLETETQRTQTSDWMVRRRKFMEKSLPETQNLLTTVMRMEAMQ